MKPHGSRVTYVRAAVTGSSLQAERESFSAIDSLLQHAPVGYNTVIC